MLNANPLQKTLALALSLSIALLPSAGVLAAEGSRVALAPVIPLYGVVPRATADKITDLLNAALRQQEGLSVVSLSAASRANDADEGGGDSGDSSDGDSHPTPFHGAGERAIAKGQGLIQKAKKDMQRLHFELAAQELEDGIAALESAFDALEDFNPLADAYLQLAIAELRLGNREGGEAAVGSFVRLEPDRGLTGSYPAVFTRLFSRVRQSATQGPKGTATVASSPAGQSVHIDGHDAGVTPAAVELIPGTHFFVVRGDGGKVAYKVDVAAGAIVQVGTGDAVARRAVHGADDAQAPAPPPVVAPPPPPQPKSTIPAAVTPLARLQIEIGQNNIDMKGSAALGQLAAAAGEAAIVFGGVHYLDEDQTTIALDCLVYQSASEQDVAALTRVQFDADLNNARPEVAKVAIEVAQKLGNWSDLVGLPTPVSPDVRAPKPGAKKLAGAHEARREDGLVASRAHGADVSQDLGPPADPQKSGFPWVAVGVGVGIGAVVIVGGILLYGALSTKAGTTPKVTW